MKTSYFTSKKWHGMNAVAISQGVPEWYKGRVYKVLAPPWWLVKEKDFEKYKREYWKILSRLDPEDVYRELGEDAVLLCWEKDPTNCHRRIVAEWFKETLGIDVPELGTESEEKFEQISLF